MYQDPTTEVQGAEAEAAGQTGVLDGGMPETPGIPKRRPHQKTLAVICVLLFLASGATYYLTHPRSSPPSQDWNAKLQCSACGRQFDARLELQRVARAYACPTCGKLAAWEMKYCSACKSLFLPPLAGNPPRPVARPACPKCKDNKHVGAYLPAGDRETLGPDS